jgi:hypothetical protein
MWLIHGSKAGFFRTGAANHSGFPARGKRFVSGNQVKRIRQLEAPLRVAAFEIGGLIADIGDVREAAGGVFVAAGAFEIGGRFLRSIRAGDEFFVISHALEGEIAGWVRIRQNGVGFTGNPHQHLPFPITTTTHGA